MAVNRRKFCRIAGLTMLGIAGSSNLTKQAQETQQEQVSTPEAPASGPKVPAEPLSGKRWAMVVNLEACRAHEGCRDCMTACHEAHNVPEFGNPKDEIKWIWKESYEKAFPNQSHEFLMEDLKHQQVPVFCNHCDDPPCTRVCPTEATWRRDDGIVMMDWHRCIGCRYCVAACPYGSRSFNWRDPRPHISQINEDFPTRTRGVVEKCTFCNERLERGKIPACVEACESKCFVFGDLEDPESEVRQLLGTRHTVQRKPGLGTRPEVYYMV